MARLLLVQRLRQAGCVFAEDEAAVLLETTTDPSLLEELVARRAAGEPLEHVVGWTRFAGLRLQVDRGVFVPRSRTEVLVRHAVSLTPPGATVVDLCCGCGAVGAAIAHAVPGVRLYASDADPAAVDNATRNLAGYDAIVGTGDLDEAIPHEVRGGVDVLVANVPYVPTRWVRYLPAEAREHEPLLALDGGGDGLDVLRRVAARATYWLRPGGWFLTECAVDQAATAVAILCDAGLESLAYKDDELDVAVAAGGLPIGS